MIIEGLGKVSFVNGIFKVQTVAINASGDPVETGQLEIPGIRVGDVINALTQAAQGIEEKLKENNPTSTDKEKKEPKEKTKKNGKKK
tara:strand:- start:353 stop:613 length:261 start_codon:yes stop_codon:yes gene_type:complete